VIIGWEVVSKFRPEFFFVRTFGSPQLLKFVRILPELCFRLHFFPKLLKNGSKIHKKIYSATQSSSGTATRPIYCCLLFRMVFSLATALHNGAFSAIRSSKILTQSRRNVHLLESWRRKNLMASGKCNTRQEQFDATQH
jgi:hypothetical protein